MGGDMIAIRDRTLTLFRQGYQFSEWLDQNVPGGGPAVPIRLLGRRTLVLRGPDGVELFYDQERAVRRHALPAPVAHGLWGRGAVHGLDGPDHRHRKQLFLEVTRPGMVTDLADRVAAKWERELDHWVRNRRGAVLPSAVHALGEAALEWAGLGEAPVVMQRRARDLAQIVDGSGAPGLPFLRARLARRRAEAWASGRLQQVRLGHLRPPTGSAAQVMAFARDADGELLPARTAAVELLNVLRPTVAVAYFVTFAALELEANPDLNDACATGDPATVRAFGEEVRRLSPLVPVLGARSRCPFAWHGHRVRAGDRLVLDVFGTNRDPRSWQDADTFDPSRFREPGQRGRPDFVPQGGGPVESGHRCPGEGIALAVLDRLVPRLARLDWQIHPDDRDLALTRMPARPDGGLRLLDVRRTYHPELR
jgi:fatty-acid peroxygenase